MAKEKTDPIDAVLRRVLDKNLPTEKDIASVNAIVDDFIAIAKDRAEELGIDVKIMLGGSVAKGTFIKDSFDSDVFFRFSLDYDDDSLSEMLDRILVPFHKGYSYRRLHGSRDYFQLRYKGISFELVPVYRIESPEDAVNVTDASPLHVRWIKAQMRKRPTLAGEILLSKLFLKANGIYGAESYIKGISGHVSDILIVNYGSFRKMLEASRTWKPKDKIDVMDHGKRLNESKLQSPIIVIDPVSPDRNAAAALSDEKYQQFRESAEKFLISPSEDFFRKKKFSISDIESAVSNGERLFVVDIIPQKGKEDVIGCRILKIHEYIIKRFRMNDFTIIDSGWEWDRDRRALSWYIVKDEKLPKEFEFTGPPISNKKHAQAFREKHPLAYERDGRMFAIQRRQYTTPLQMIASIINDSFISSRAEKCSLRSKATDEV